MSIHSRGYIAVGLWVLAGALMVYDTLNYGRDGTPAGFAWGIFTSVIAMTVTTTVAVERCCQQREEEVTIEQVTDIVDALQNAKQGVALRISPHS